jgi:cell division initiation protein
VSHPDGIKTIKDKRGGISMLTPQEVEERVFPKAKKNGYDMQDVDSFLDQLTADYSDLYKENAVLKRKMKVLADKITEYQETEGAMRATLLAAQKMANELVEDAKAKRAKLLEEAESIARERTGKLTAEVAAEEARLKSARASVAAMTASIRDLLAHEQEFLDALPEMEVEIPEPDTTTVTASEAADAVADEIGDSIRRMMESETAETEQTAAPTEAAAPAVEVAAPAEADQEPTRPVIVDDPVDDAPTRRLDLSELRFGRNYEIK